MARPGFYLIADTNVYLSHLALLKRLRRQSQVQHGKAHLYVPSTVVAELRSQRRRRAGDNDTAAGRRRAAWLRQHARRSLAFILAMRIVRPTNVRFETKRERQQAARLYGRVGNDGDSRILQSLLFLRRNIGNGSDVSCGDNDTRRAIILWSADRRFRVRANAAGISALDFRGIHAFYGL